MNYLCLFGPGSGALDEDLEQVQKGNPWDKAGKTYITKLIPEKIIWYM